MNWVALLYLLAFSVTVGGTALVLALTCHRSPLDRLEKFLPRLHNGLSQKEKAKVGLPEESFIDRILRPLAEKWVSTVARISPDSIKARASLALLEAGNPWGLDVGKYMALKLMLIVAGLAFVTVVMPALRLAETSLLIGVVGAGFGYVIPDFIVGSLARQRKEQIAGKLPETLDLLTVSIEAGLSFDGALQKVCEKTKGPLSEEFTRLLQDIQVGKPRREAFRTLADRTTVEDLTNFLNALIQADRLGVSMGNILRVQSTEIRRRKKQRAEEAAMKVSVKIIFPMVLFILPGLFLVVLGPAILQLIDNFGGGGLF